MGGPETGVESILSVPVSPAEFALPMLLLGFTNEWVFRQEYQIALFEIASAASSTQQIRDSAFRILPLSFSDPFTTTTPK